jgi:hypothetical protein
MSREEDGSLELGPPLPVAPDYFDEARFREVLVGWDEGDVTRGELLDAALVALTVENTDRIIDALPDDRVRAEFFQELRELSSQPTIDNAFDLTSNGCFAIAEVRKKHYATVTFPAVLAWLARSGV